MSIRRARQAVVLAAVAALLPFGAVGAAAEPAAPVRAAAPVGVSADALPTVQVDGVVWAQVVVGKTVYATGSFRTARPAGAAPGTRTQPRSNLLAYDIGTGKVRTAWKPSLNAQGVSIAASQDGRRIFVGGDFTQVNGVVRRHLVALDATTGAVVPGFAVAANGTVAALNVAGNTLFAGGTFTTANSRPRTRLAAFDATTGAIYGWAPVADAKVEAIAFLPGGDKVVVGGRFAALNGSRQLGMGALNPRTGTTLAWPANTVIKNFGANAGIGTLLADATGVYAAGWAFRVGNFESIARMDNAGRIVMVSGCRGDTYGLFPLAGVVYTVGHPHDCEAVPGGFVQRAPTPRFTDRAIAFSAAAGGVNKDNAFGSFFTGRPAPALLHWYPTLTAGTYTGQTQAAWSITGNSTYVVLGGEFTKVNGVAQQGLVRFAVRTVAPNRQGPQPIAKPELSTQAAGTARIRWTTTWDRDDATLSYELLRDTTVVGRIRRTTNEHDRPVAGITDTGVPPGTYGYRVRATDPSGNVTTSPGLAVTVTG